MERSITPKTLFAFGLNHKTAPIEIREKLVLTEQEVSAFLETVRPTLSECLVLSTCNRTEIYGVSDSRQIDLAFYKAQLLKLKGAAEFVQEEHFFSYISCGACQQLFNVATSIDSKIIGDSQILRQVRRAYELARERGYTGKILNQLAQRAFKLGKATYTQSAIHDGAACVSLAAVELARKTLGSLQGRSVLVIGAGETARLTSEILIDKEVGKLFVTNRTRAHAEELLAAVHAENVVETQILDFDNFKDRLDEVDIIISSTGSVEPILSKADLAGRGRKMLVIDIAVPRDIDPAVAENPNVILKNIDELLLIIDDNQKQRLRDLPKVKAMIYQEMADFLTWYYLLPILPNYEKTGTRPSPAQGREILRIKQLLNQNISEIHTFAASAGSDFNSDLETHFSLITKLQRMRHDSMDDAIV